MAGPERFSKVKKMLEQAGYHLVRVRGSHHIFEKPGEVEHINIPVHGGKVKNYYVREVEKILSKN